MQKENKLHISQHLFERLLHNSMPTFSRANTLKQSGLFKWFYVIFNIAVSNTKYFRKTFCSNLWVFCICAKISFLHFIYGDVFGDVYGDAAITNTVVSCDIIGKSSNVRSIKDFVLLNTHPHQ